MCSTMAEIVRTTPFYIMSQSGSCVYMEMPLALLLVVSVHVFFYTLKSNYEHLGVKFKGHSDKTLQFHMKHNLRATSVPVAEVVLLVL